MRKAEAVIALALIITVVGCATIPIESKMKKPVSMTKMKDTQVKHFVVQKQVFWAFWGLVPLRQPKIDKVIEREVADHTGVQNLKVTAKHSLANYIVTLMTISFIHSKTIVIDGEVYD